jgi:hypothetical protein
VGRSLTGSNPLAGPAAVSAAGFGGGAPRGAGLAAGGRPSQRAALAMGGRGLPGFGPPPGVGRSSSGRGAGPMGASVGKTTIGYLETHQGSARYMVAAVGSTTAGAIALQSGHNVIDIGGFNGSDPSPSLSQLKQLIKSGQLHYVVLNANRNGAGRFTVSSSATRERDGWIESHGKAIKITGEGNTGSTLYYLSSVV